MSNFKIVQAGSLTVEQRDTVLPRAHNLILPTQIMLLNYPLEQLRDQVQAYFQEPPIDRLSLVKALKVIGCSLNDNKLISAVQKIISVEVVNQGKQVYELLALWASQRFHLPDFVNKLSPPSRKTLLFLIFEEFLMGNHCRQLGIQQQLSAFLPFISQDELLPQLKKHYDRNKNPLKIVIRKCRIVQTQHQELRQLLITFASTCIGVKVERLMEFTMEDDRQELQYLIQNVPNMSSTFIGQLKLTITQDNIGRLISDNSRINSVLQTAVKEWLNQKNNYWRVVQRGLQSTFREETRKVIDYGKMIIKEGLQSECITVQLLYCYLEGRYFDFARGDAFVTGTEKENWMETYRSIGQCCSYRMVNLIVLNKTLAPSWWKPSDPRKFSSSNKNVKKLMEKHSDFFQEKEKELASVNKKIELAFSVLIVVDKQTNQQHILTFEQLQKWLKGETPPKLGFRDEYSPFKAQVKQKEEIKKEHNIVIEAKLVRILKRAKESLTVQGLAKESGYNIQTVELGVKRLVSKSLAEEDGKGAYQYLA